jgi:hypothetical protein
MFAVAGSVFSGQVRAVGLLRLLVRWSRAQV